MAAKKIFFNFAKHEIYCNFHSNNDINDKNIPLWKAKGINGEG